MKFVFYASDKPRENMLAAAFGAGLKILGHDYEIRRPSVVVPYCRIAEVAIFFGVKSKPLFDEYHEAGYHTILLDKGYTRDRGGCGHTKYTRAIINARSPASYMMSREYSDDRFSKLGIVLQPRQKSRKNDFILFCDSTDKYHKFHSLKSPSKYARSVLADIRQYSKRPVVRRQKASAPGRPSTMAEALSGCHVVVTHGSSAAMDAILAGVPAVVLGEGIASPVSGHTVAGIDNPFYPDAELLQKWANAMAYCQWTTEEINSGEAIQHWISILEGAQ